MFSNKYSCSVPIRLLKQTSTKLQGGIVVLRNYTNICFPFHHFPMSFTSSFPHKFTSKIELNS